MLFTKTLQLSVSLATFLFCYGCTFDKSPDVQTEYYVAFPGGFSGWTSSVSTEQYKHVQCPRGTTSFALSCEQLNSINDSSFQKLDNHYLSPNWITLIHESPLETTNGYICVIKLTNPEYVKTQIDFASSKEEAEYNGAILREKSA
jgi:hypothetical protein